MQVTVRQRNKTFANKPQDPHVNPDIAYRTSMALLSTAWGTCSIVWRNDCDDGQSAFVERSLSSVLCRIVTPGLSQAEIRHGILKMDPSCREVLAHGHNSFHPEVVPEWFGDLAGYLEGYYSCQLRDWTQPQFLAHWAFWRPRLDWSQLTLFQRQVLETVAEIPGGALMTYGQVAARIGKPRASRAVGAAVGANPWPVLVPCHRVVGHQGQLTGFSAPGGIETKRRMLALEMGEGLFH